jgi:hypothetical protein
MAIFPFVPTSDTNAIQLGVAAATPVLLTSPQSVDRAIRIVNTTALNVWISFGATSEMATENAVIPTASAPTRTIMCPAGLVEVIGFPFDTTYISGISESGTPLIYVTEGRGI